MTTLVKTVAGNSPQIHALVIGVGGYRYLSGSRDANPDRQIDGEQLSSPPHSARAFVDWLLRTLRHPDAELGTIDFLLSASDPDLHRYPRPDTGELVEIELADMGHVEPAFWRWVDQLQDERNVGIFYFCGHGLQRKHTALLLEDFGANAMAPFTGAIDFDGNWLGLARCPARQQYYFIDACQSSALAMKSQLNDEARVFLPGQYGAQHRRGATFFGTARSQRAYGTRNGPSEFTTALIESLDGPGAALDDNEEWRVTPLALQNAIDRALADRHRFAGVPKQDPRLDEQVGNDPIHKLDGVPLIPLTVISEPDEALPYAALTVGPQSGPPIETREAEPGAWRVKLHPAEYRITASFTMRWQYLEDKVTVMTPRRTKLLRVK